MGSNLLEELRKLKQKMDEASDFPPSTIATVLNNLIDMLIYDLECKSNNDAN